MKNIFRLRQLCCQIRPGSDLRSVGRYLQTISVLFVAMMAVSCAFAEGSRTRETAGVRRLFREDWKTTPAELPITQDHVATDGLILALHGPGKQWIKKSHHDQPADDPFYLWSGQCQKRWAFSLRPKRYSIDLSTPNAKLRLRAKQGGGHELYLLIKMPSKQWYISRQSIPTTLDWQEFELKMADLNWSRFDVVKIIRGKNEAPASLKAIEEIGLTDLRPGKGSKACSRVDWIEVWGNAVARNTK